MVTIRFESEPAGAHVARVTDDKDLGAVPFEIKLPRAGGKPEYRFHLEGYQDQTLTADLASDQTLSATLEKTAPPAAGAGRRRRPRPRRARRDAAPTGTRPRTTRRARRTRVAGDDDGLATPKF